MSRVFQILTIFILAELLLSCTGRTEQPRTLTSTDSLWLNFATAMERNDLEYLLANSLDSIRCVDCNPTTPNWEDEVYEAEYLFRNHLTDLMHLDNLNIRIFYLPGLNLIKSRLFCRSTSSRRRGIYISFYSRKN